MRALRRRALASLTAGLLLAAVLATPAFAAETPAPGWEVASQAFPTNLPPPASDVQQLTVAATGGTFKLSFEGETTGAAGEGSLESGSKKVKSLTASSGTFVAGEAIEGEGIPAETTIAKVGSGNLELSKAATETKPADPLSANLPYNAGHETLQAALGALKAIGPANLTVSGGPGDASGSHPYKITFAGGLANANLGPIRANGAALGGEGAHATATVLTQGASGKGTVSVDVFNVGAADSHGPITVTDTLPAGITATAAGEANGSFVYNTNRENPSIANNYWQCAIAPGTEANSIVTCHNNEEPERLASIAAGGHPAYAPNQLPYNPDPIIGLAVRVSPGAEEGPQPNRVTISGGGGAPAASTDPVTVGASPAGPVPFSISAWDAFFSTPEGGPDTQAGSHPENAYFTVAFPTKYIPGGGGSIRPLGEPRNLEVQLPAGLAGNPTATPHCPRAAFVNEKCPTDTEVGYLVPSFAQVGPVTRLVYNLAPPPGQAAEFALTVEGQNVFFDSGVRAGADYGVTTHVRNIAEVELDGSILVLWGTPEAPSHDRWREASSKEGGCSQKEVEEGGCRHLTERLPKPLFTMPTSCGSPQPFSIEADSWTDPAFSTPNTVLFHESEGQPEGFSGCAALPFEPTISSKPTTDTTDNPSGLEFDLHFPLRGLEEPEARAEADVKKNVVTLPEGFVVDPSSGNGLAACSEAQIGYKPGSTEPPEFSPEAAQCPDASKIGTVEVDTPLVGRYDEEGKVQRDPEGKAIPRPLKGAVYVAKPTENPFGSLLAIYITVKDPESGLVIKLAGDVRANPQTGQLETVVESPQQPFEDFHLNFFGGAGAALRTPPTCGTYETTTDFTPWSSPEGADATPEGSFELTKGANESPTCPHSEAEEPNKPSFFAGTVQPKAGAYSPFVLHLARADGTQEIKRIDTVLPPGLSGKLAGIGECSSAQIAQAKSREVLGGGREEIASPSCPLNSEVGKVTVGSGAGPDPYYVTGHAYLAGPYKGAPLSLAIVTPAVAGPYDLGAVVVQTALYVNPETAQITAKSDEVPHILQGIPLDVRSIDLEMSRPQFTLNPTSCAKMSVLGTSTSALNQSAPLSYPFQVGECAKLGFAPKLAIKLKGGTKRNQNPALTATVTYPTKGAYANIAGAAVTLPHSEFLDNAHIGTVCTRVQFAEGAVLGEKCPAASIYGFARATSPLLEKPVEGPVYLRSSSNKLPDLVAALNGQIDVALDGRIDTGKGGGIRNTFEVVPDAPVSEFTLSMQGGKKGLLVNSENICAKPQHAVAKFTAQNGKVDDFNPLIANSCKKKAKKHKRHLHRASLRQLGPAW